MVAPGYSFYNRNRKPNKTMSTTTTTPTTTATANTAAGLTPTGRPRRKMVVNVVRRSNESALNTWISSKIGSFGHNSLRSGSYRRQLAAQATADLGFKVTGNNLLSRYIKARNANSGGVSAVAAAPSQTPASHVPMTTPTDDVSALKRVANEHHARVTSLENQVRRLFAIARKYVPSEDISAPQTDLTRPFASV